MTVINEASLQYVRYRFFNSLVPGICGSNVLSVSLQWRHNALDGVLNHQPHDCLLNCLFGRRSKKTSKLRVNGLCVGNSPGADEFPAQMASNAENVSIWWRHHVFKLILRIDIFGSSYEVGSTLLTENLTDDKSTLIQVKAWCHQATSHYPSHCSPKSMSPYGFTRPQWCKTHCSYNSGHNMLDMYAIWHKKTRSLLV